MSTYTQDITHLIGKINTNLPDNDTQAITAARIRDAMGAVAYNYDLYVLKTDLDTAGYVTASQLEGLATEQELQEGMQTVHDDAYAYVVEKINEIPGVDLSAYVTKTELSEMGYITESSLGDYVTESQLQSTLTAYITQEELSGMGYITENDLPDMSTYVTESQLQQAGYATKAYVADYVAEHAPMPDLSAYVTKTELSAAGYLTAVPSEYVTDTELSSMGYITEAALGDYVTETELSQAGYITETELGQVLSTASYVTQNELSNAGYITNSDLSQASYVTQQALSGMGYLTTVPSEYVTESELSAMSYATTSDLTSKQDTLVSGTNIKTINNESLLGSGNIDIQAGGTPNYSHVLTFTAKQNSSWIRLSRNSNAPTISIQYSIDNGATWTEYSIGTSISLNNNKTVKFKGTNTTISNSSGWYQFAMGGKIAASGDITSLLNEEGGDYDIPNTCFKYLFSNCQVLTTAPNLPSTTIGEGCYEQMFYNCKLIEEAPELPATTAPANCYKFMFQSCTALKKVPRLPATTLGDMCYANMFLGCTSLEEAPELPATSLTSTNYYAMFSGCTSLRYIKAMILTGIQTNTFNWVGSVAANGVFVMNANATWNPEQNRGVSGIPSGWTVYTTVALDTDIVPDSYVEDEGKTLQVVNGLWTKVTGGGGDMSAYVTKTELSAMSYATTTQLSAKQDTLVSGTNIKTINNTSLLGSGDITISGGSSITAVTQAEYDAMEQAGTLDPDTLYIISDAQSADLDDYVTKTELSSAGYLTAVPSEYITETELSAAGYITSSYAETYYVDYTSFGDYTSDMQSTLVDANILITDPETGDWTTQPMASETYVADYVASYAPTPDLSAYVTKTELSAAGYLTAVPSEYVTESEIASMGYITETELSGMSYATTSYVADYVASYAPTPDLSAYVSKTELSAMSYATTTQVNAKQDTLVSGTNIKTINNESLLGSGNIDIQAGGTPDYSHVLTFTAEQANSTVNMQRVGTASSLASAVLQYSTDNGDTWNEYTLDTTITLSAVGDTVKFKGTNVQLGKDAFNYHKFVMTGKIAASGDITSLFNETGGDMPMPANACLRLFVSCAALTKAPSLPSTILGSDCYNTMFSSCTSLTVAPELPATTLASQCYSNMFNGCTSLTKAPELPAMTLAQSCYSQMFYRCTSLTKAPVLPATTLVTQCYYMMFNSCTQLNYVKAMFTTTPSNTYTQNWLQSVASTGTFIKNNSATWTTTGISAVPTTWTVYKTVALDTDNVPESYVEDNGKGLQVVNGVWEKVSGLLTSANLIYDSTTNTLTINV